MVGALVMVTIHDAIEGKWTSSAVSLAMALLNAVTLRFWAE